LFARNDVRLFARNDVRLFVNDVRPQLILAIQITAVVWRLRFARYCLRAGRLFAYLGERLYGL
jgi:hypothetical protein